MSGTRGCTATRFQLISHSTGRRALGEKLELAKKISVGPGRTKRRTKMQIEL